MSTTIAKEDIQVGDTIRITREAKVETVWSYAIKSTDGGLYDTKDATIELIDRPLPPLPDVCGSVVKVTHSPSDVSANWLLHNGGQWVSASGTRKTGPDLLRWMQDYGYTFEVLG